MTSATHKRRVLAHLSTATHYPRIFVRGGKLVYQASQNSERTVGTKEAASLLGVPA